MLAGTLEISTTAAAGIVGPIGSATAGPIGIGTLALDGGTLIGAATFNLFNNVVFDGGNTINLTSGNAIFSGSITFASPGVGVPDTILLSDNGTGSLNLNGGNIVIDSDVAFSGAMTTGSVILGSNADGGVISVDMPHQLTFNETLTSGTNEIRGDLAIGTNTLTLAALSSTSAFVLGDANDVLVGNGNLTIAPNTTIKAGNSGDTLYGTLNVSDPTAKFDLNAFNFTVGSIAGPGPIINSNTGTTVRTLAVGIGNASGSYSGAIDATANGAGAIANVALLKVGTGTQTLSSPSFFTGGVTVGGGTLNPSFTSTTTSNLLAAANILTLSGGDLKITANGTDPDTQTFASTTLGAGESTVDISSFQSAAATLALGKFTRGSFATLNFVTPTAGNGNITTTSGTSSSILGFWATVNGTDYATTSSGNIVALGAAVNDVDSTWTATTNVVFDQSIVLSGNRSVNTLRYVGSGPATIDLSSFSLGAFNLTSLAILNDGTGTLTIEQGVASAGSVVLPSGNDFLLDAGSGADIAITAPITGGTTNAILKNGSGTLTLSGNNSAAAGEELGIQARQSRGRLLGSVQHRDRRQLHARRLHGGQLDARSRRPVRQHRPAQHLQQQRHVLVRRHEDRQLEHHGRRDPDRRQRRRLDFRRPIRELRRHGHHPRRRQHPHAEPAQLHRHGQRLDDA